MAWWEWDAPLQIRKKEHRGAETAQSKEFGESNTS